jgi:ribonuclease HII
MITVGIDEVGRGCWAGPLVAGAVILPSHLDLAGLPVKLRDSKKLSKKQRESADQWIQEHALAIGLGWVTPREIDSIGITESVRLAMQRALEAIKIEYEEIIVDGNFNYFAKNPKAREVIKADDSVPAVSAASIAAKVARDSYMSDLGEAYEGYGFASHVGYGTAAHIAALKKLGVCDLHRRSYKPIQTLLA